MNRYYIKKKVWLNLFYFSTLLILFFYFPTTTLKAADSSAGTCNQLVDDLRERCQRLAASCTNQQGCEEASSRSAVSSKVNETCITSGLSVSVCSARVDAADTAMDACRANNEPLSTCITRAQDAANINLACPPNTTQAHWLTSPVGSPCRDSQGVFHSRVVVPSSSAGTQTQQTAQTCTGPNCGNLGYVPLEPIGFDLSGIQNTNQNAFGEWLSFLLKIAISVGGLIAVVMLVFGGVVYMVSEVVDKKHEALERIQASFLGLFILIASWLILNTINPQLVTGTNFFRITPGSGTSAIPPASTPPASQQSIQQAVNECLARSASRTCVYVHDPSGPQCRC